MFFDLLHQMLKDIASIYLNEWMKRTMIANCTTKNEVFVQLNKTYRRVSFYTELNEFKHFIKMNKWQKSQHKQILRQMLSTMTSLLKKTKSEILFCIKIMINFYQVAKSYSHTKKTLRQMNHYLKIFDTIKNVLRSYHANNQFSQFKMHSLVHYIHFIKEFEVLIFLNIDIDEQNHINYLKRFFQRINKRRNFETQTLRHDIRKLNVFAIKNMKRYIKNRQQSENEIDETLKINRITKAKNIENLKWSRSKVELQHLRRHKCNFKNWCWASIAAKKIDVSDVLQILVVFIKQKRAKKVIIDSIENVFTKVIRELNYTLKSNIDWMIQCFYKCIKIWKCETNWERISKICIILSKKYLDVLSIDRRWANVDAILYEFKNTNQTISCETTNLIHEMKEWWIVWIWFWLLKIREVFETILIRQSILKRWFHNYEYVIKFKSIQFTTWWK